MLSQITLFEFQRILVLHLQLNRVRIDVLHILNVLWGIILKNPEGLVVLRNNVQRLICIRISSLLLFQLKLVAVLLLCLVQRLLRSGAFARFRSAWLLPVVS